MRILAFGDSITYGRNDSQGGWVDRIKRVFLERNYGNPDAESDIVNLGVRGNTSADLLKRVEHEIQARQKTEHALGCVIAIGINDSRVARRSQKEEIPPAEFEANLRAVLAICRRYSEKILLVGLTSVEDAELRYEKYVYSNERIRMYDAIISQICADTGLPKVELFEAFREWGSSVLFKDGLHPNDAGHELMAELIKPEIDKLIA